MRIADLMFSFIGNCCFGGNRTMEGAAVENAGMFGGIKSAARPCGIYYVYLDRLAFQGYKPRKSEAGCREEF